MEYEEETEQPDLKEVVQGLNFVQQRLNTDTILEGIENSLRGNKKDFSSGNWIIGGTKLLNDQGVNSLMSIIRMYVNTNTLLGNLTEQEIANMLYSLSSKLTRELLANKKIWELSFNWSTIRTIVTDVVEITLSRAKNGGERELLSKVIHVTENISKLAKEDQGGILGIKSGGQ